MNSVAIVFAKLAAFKNELASQTSDSFSPSEIREYFERYALLRTELIKELAGLYGDLPARRIGSYDSASASHIRQLRRDLDYIFEVRANSELRWQPDLKAKGNEPDQKLTIFISHGRSPDWREVQSYIEKDLNIGTLELAQEPNRGRTVLQKLVEESAKCTFAVVVMTGDDNSADGTPRARENVLHEIGFFQGSFGLDRVCLLHEEGTNIPSNIHGLVYIPFPKGLVSASFGVLTRELNATLSRSR